MDLIIFGCFGIRVIIMMDKNFFNFEVGKERMNGEW